MTDDAIQDILEQTESDPAFQALFDLFDYGKIYYACTPFTGLIPAHYPHMYCSFLFLKFFIIIQS